MKFSLKKTNWDLKNIMLHAYARYISTYRKHGVNRSTFTTLKYCVKLILKKFYLEISQ